MKRFSVAKKWLGDLDPETASTLITAASDVALVINAGEGVIRGVAFGSEELERDLRTPEDLVGRAWIDTVTVESRPKIEALLRDATSRAEPRWRQVNHVVAGTSAAACARWHRCNSG